MDLSWGGGVTVDIRLEFLGGAMPRHARHGSAANRLQDMALPLFALGTA